MCVIACVDFNLFHSEEVFLSLSLKKKNQRMKKQIAQGWKWNKKEQWKSENIVLFLSGLKLLLANKEFFLAVSCVLLTSTKLT